MLNKEKDQQADTKSTNHSQIITTDTSFPFSDKNFKLCIIQYSCYSQETSFCGVKAPQRYKSTDGDTKTNESACCSLSACNSVSSFASG